MKKIELVLTNGSVELAYSDRFMKTYNDSPVLKFTSGGVDYRINPAHIVAVKILDV